MTLLYRRNMSGKEIITPHEFCPTHMHESDEDCIQQTVDSPKTSGGQGQLHSFILL